MICRAERRVLALAAVTLMLALAGCGEPPDTRTPLECAQADLAAGDILGAELVLEDLLSDGTAREDLAAYLGEAELRQGKYAEARRWLGPGKFSRDSAGRGFHMLGKLELAEGDLPAAGAAYDEAYRFKPDDPGLWADIGRLRYAGGEQLEAIDASVKAVELGPHNPEALRLHAQLVREAEGASAALPIYARALEVDPGNLDLKADYAAVLGDAGRATDMLVILRQLHNSNPRDPRPYFMQAVLAARAGKYELARSLLLRGGISGEDEASSGLLVGIVDLENGNYDSAAQTFGRLLREQPDNRRFRHLLARALSLGGSHREVVYRFGETAGLPSASPYLRTMVARAYEALGDREVAASYLDRAARVRESDLVAVQSVIPLSVAEVGGREQGENTVALVRGNIVAGRRRAAVVEAEGFRGRFPGSGDALSLAADAYLVAGNAGKALDFYEDAARIRRPWPLTRRNYTALIALGREDDARDLIIQHLAGEPANSEAAAMLAYIAVARQEWREAGIYADLALANGASRSPEMHVLRSRIARSLGDGDKARHHALLAVILQPMNRHALETLQSLETRRWGARYRVGRLGLGG